MATTIPEVERLQRIKFKEPLRTDKSPFDYQYHWKPEQHVWAPPSIISVILHRLFGGPHQNLATSVSSPESWIYKPNG